MFKSLMNSGKNPVDDQDKSKLVAESFTGGGKVVLVDKDEFESMLKVKSVHLKKCKYYLASAKDSEVSISIQKKNKKIGFGCLSPESVTNSHGTIFTSDSDVEAIRKACGEHADDTLVIGYNSKGQKPTLLLTATVMRKLLTSMFRALEDVVLSPACSPVQLADFTYSSFSEIESLRECEFGTSSSEYSTKTYKKIFDSVDSGIQLKVKEGPTGFAYLLGIKSTGEYTYE